MTGDNDSIQRALNEAKRRALQERYGAIFGGETDGLPPDLERDWLEYIEEFERKSEQADFITVRAFLGNPRFPPVGTMTTGELAIELQRLLELLDQNAVHVEFPPNITTAEQYRSITEELFDEEMEDIRIDGMVHVFIYGEGNDEDAEDEQRPSSS
jgi:hypothetical protein